MSAGLTDALSRYLDLTSDQMKVTAANMANVDTPGYKTRGFDFAGEFQQALGTSGNAYGGPAVSDVGGLVARPDGNTVSLDRESMQLAKTQLQFRMGVEFLKHEFNQTMGAIHAEMK